MTYFAKKLKFMLNQLILKRIYFSDDHQIQFATQYHIIYYMQSTNESSYSLSQFPDFTPIPKVKMSKLSGHAYQTSDEQEKLYTFYLDVVLNENVELPKIQIYIPISYTVQHAIQLALRQFQRELVMECVIIEQQVDDFVPWMSKKSGKCKMDIPAIDKERILYQIDIDTISLQVINKDSVAVDKSRKRRSSLDQENQYKQIGYKKNHQLLPEQEQKPQSTCFFSFC